MTAALRPGVDPGTPTYEQARVKLVGFLREIGAKNSRNGYSAMADRVEVGGAVDIPSWVAMQMLAAAPALPSDEERLAYMLCEADGRDPHQMTYHTVEPGVQEPYGDAWTRYLPQARKLIELAATPRETKP